MHKEIKDEVASNGKICGKFSQKIDILKFMKEKPKAAVQTEVEIPCKGVDQIIETNSDLEASPEKRQENNLELKEIRNDIDKVNSFSKIKYRPHHMAEYIFWTGDEKGVALAIEEFLEEGLMSRQEAINFLQSVKYNLDIMQSQYQGVNKIDGKMYKKEKLNRKRKMLSKINLPEKSKMKLYDEQNGSAKIPPIDLSGIKSDASDIMASNQDFRQGFSLHELNAPKTQLRVGDNSVTGNREYPKLSIVGKTFEGGPENFNDYGEITEGLKIAGSSQNEYSLENIIFKLAEIMFSESLTKGNVEAQKATEKFSSFLQKQVEEGQISRKLLRKILDVLSSALMNVISEHPEVLNKSKEGMQTLYNRISPTSEALRLLLLGTKQLPDQSSLEEELSEKTILLKNKKLTKELLSRH